MSVKHDTFVIERAYDAAPDRVFAAWADPEAKARWFGGGDVDSPTEGLSLDFRVGGRESIGGTAEGSRFAYEALYQDIVEDERIVYTYEVLMDGVRMSVSLATVQLETHGDGTRLVFTEQGVFLDDRDSAELRSGGTGQMLDGLARLLAREGANA